jgi:hypothetical protein
LIEDAGLEERKDDDPFAPQNFDKKDTSETTKIKPKPIISSNYSYIQGKKYSSTPYYEFSYENNFASPSLMGTSKVAIAKNGNKGFIVLSIPLSGSKHHITWPIRILLTDGTLITCVDRGIRDKVNMTSTAVYYLTESEINKLKKHNILKIRYSVNEYDMGGVKKYEMLNIKPTTFEKSGSANSISKGVTKLFQ